MNLVASHVTEQIKLLNSIFVRYCLVLLEKCIFYRVMYRLALSSRDFCFGFISRRMINPPLCHGKAMQTVLNTAKSPPLQVSLLRNSDLTNSPERYILHFSKPYQQICKSQLTLIKIKLKPGIQEPLKSHNAFLFVLLTRGAS